MDAYKELVKTVLLQGVVQDCRNGSQVIIPFYSFVLDFSKGKSSAKLKLRKMYFSGIEGEFNTLVSDEELTNVSQFEVNGCNYWKSWAGPKGELNLDYANMLKPQLKDVIENIKKDPTSRRHVIELWNYKNLKELNLPCCWHGLTFSVINNTLFLKWTQRSVDVMVGLPSDIYLAYLFMEYIANATNLKIGTCLFSLSNVHIYTEHIENAYKLLERTEEDFDKPLKFELKA